MAVIRTWTDRVAAGVADFVVRFRWLVILAAVIGTGLAATGMRHLEFANNYRVFFSGENPELLTFEKFQATYTKNDNIIFVLKPADGQILNPRFAQAQERLTAGAWKIPFAIRVDSLTNFQNSWADGDDLTVEDLVRDGVNLRQEELDRRKAIALAEPLLNGNLISPDADTAGVNVTLQYPGKSLTEVPEAVGYARQLAVDLRRDFPDLQIALSGISMLNNSFAESGQKDVMTLIPIMYGVLIVVMAVILRSFTGTFVTLLVIGFSTLTAMGLAGYAGVKLTPISVTAPTVILTLAIADSIHILISMLAVMREGRDKIFALKESLRINFLAVTVTSITTVIGFLALNFSDSPPFWHLGNITAAGIVAAWAYSLFFMPAVVSLLPMRVRARSAGAAPGLGSMERLANFVIARFRAILVGTGAVAAVLIAAIPTLELNDSWVEYFDHRVQFRNDAEFALENLSGLYPIEYSIEAAEPGGISEPEYLRNLDAFTGWLRAQPEVRHVFSYADIIKRLNKNLHADNPEWYRMPSQRDLAAQYLLLYELSLPYGLDMNDRVSIDKGATRVTATLDNISTVGVRAFNGRAVAWLNDNTPDYMHARPTSATVMFSHISERNIDGMLRGNLVAIVLIAGIMILSLRSLPLGALSLIPNAIPILMTFGVWALMVGQAGMAAAIVSATSLGIIVDNTVHFMTKYLRARRERGFDQADAIRYTFQTVGAAIAANAVILSFGFAVLAASTFKVNAEMGLLTALAILIALAVDFLLLPSLLLIGYDKEKGRSHDDARVSQAA